MQASAQNGWVMSPPIPAEGNMQYGKNNRGYEFPMHDGELLSWSIGLYHTHKQQLLGFPKMRTVIRAMMERRPEELERERREMLKGSFDRIFGHNAKVALAVIESELALADAQQDADDEPELCEVCGRPEDLCPGVFNHCDA